MRRRDESGATAVLVGLLATFLIGMSAFVADFGMAYANKRQSQTAADGAALGAAGVFALKPGSSCTDILTAGSAEANGEAVAKVNENDDHMANPGGLTDYSATCETDGLVVQTEVDTTSPSFFGGLFGDSDGYEVTREAAAIVEAATTVGAGLRPLALCSKDITTITTFPSPVMKVNGPGQAANSIDCPDANTGGNWWTINCPEDNGNGDLAENVLEGCEDPVSIVPGQGGLGPAALSSHLLGYCPDFTTHPESCLGADPGSDLVSNGTIQAFKTLVTSGETIFFPAFCASPQCTPAAISPDNGNGVIYPVHKLIAVQLCGFHFSQKNSGSIAMHGDCGSANNPNNYHPSDGDNQENYILVSVQQIQVSGGTSPSGCRIGDPCDTGLRQIRMVDPEAY